MPKSGSKNGRIAPEKSANTENGVAMNGKRAGIIICIEAASQRSFQTFILNMYSGKSREPVKSSTDFPRMDFSWKTFSLLQKQNWR